MQKQRAGGDPDKQQRHVAQQLSLQHTASGADDYLDCDELYSGSEQEEGSCTDSGSEQQHEGDELPLIAPVWTPDHTFKVR